MEPLAPALAGGLAPVLRPSSIDKRRRHPMFRAGVGYTQNDRNVHHHHQPARRAPDQRAGQGRAGAALFRVSVEGGGCSGFQYRFDLVKETAPDDVLVERDGARVVVDPVSLGFVPAPSSISSTI